MRGAVQTILGRRHPTQVVVLGFLSVIAVGTVLLRLPIASEPTADIGVREALFTSTSAATVTGLIVVDTSTAWTTFGQVVILALIQVGGFGLMAVSSVVAVVLARRIGLRHRMAAQAETGALRLGDLRSVVLGVVGWSLVVEGVTAVLLSGGFVVIHGEGVVRGTWMGLFHSVSAFNNAGFALQSDSLVLFQSSPLALHTIALLIVIGGIGFGVLMGASELWRRRRGPMSLHVKLVLTTNAVLLGVAFFGWLVSEWNGSLAGMGMGERLNNAWFQSVTMRTAGFTSVDFGALSHATILIMLVWMFIGASPGSTGGGIKTTTIAVLFAAVASVVRGRDDAEAFGRRLARRVVYRAAAIATISAAVVFVGSLALMLTQGSSFEETLFEATSAFGTVGLSLGITGDLDHTGKLIVMMLMLVGRTGPLTMALVFRRQDPMPVRYPEEEVMVG